ncbi:MAG TPA: tRNA cyclic N6-threonylcarbamoyladenosine(37) synthase TcdA [Chthoniobacteraceae bacterium]|nr:tRNA cyclic N6-threonylcarbamoyladenosine(37) synthase TcdA [Chthoniobacteraceae bacterium]
MQASAESDYQQRFSGIARLYGAEGAARLRAAHVAIVGVGGVGSWSVESLARSGIGALTLIDLDEVCVSNVNRQLPALTSEVGKPKVQVLRDRILGINPHCKVSAVEEFFTATNVSGLLAPPFTSVLDAIDDVRNKSLLLAECVRRQIPVVTVGGAGGRRDSTAIRIADLAHSSHDKLLVRLRKILRVDYNFPMNPKTPFGIPCVYSIEPPVFPQSDGTVCEARGDATELRMNCNSGYGSATHVTGAFGFAAAAEVINGIVAAVSKYAPEPASRSNS